LLLKANFYGVPADNIVVLEPPTIVDRLTHHRAIHSIGALR